MASAMARPRYGGRRGDRLHIPALPSARCLWDDASIQRRNSCRETARYEGEPIIRVQSY